MCVLSIKVPIRKKSGNLCNDPRIYKNFAFSTLHRNVRIFAGIVHQLTSPHATQAWDLVDDFAALKGWNGVLHVNQVESQHGVGHVGTLDIFGVESSSY